MAIETTDGKMMTIQCRHCTEIFAIPARRGRPQYYCDQCISSGLAPTSDVATRDRKEQLAKERIDRLEIMLRSRGLHLKQNLEPWR